MIDEKNIKFLMSCFDYRLQASKEEYLDMFERTLNNSNEYNINKIKVALNKAAENKKFNWVSLAIETNLVYSSKVDQQPNYIFTKNDLLEYLNSNIWDWVLPNNILSEEIKLKLNVKFSQLEEINYVDISKIINSKEYSLIPFEVKHQFKMKFGKIEYTSEDIIYYLKSMVWDYFYPDFFSQKKMDKLGKECHNILCKTYDNNGWVEMASIKDDLESSFPNLDLYELSQIQWDKTVQHKMHYRNPFTLGFIRNNPEKEKIEET